MESVGISSAAGVAVRPAIALSSDLAAVLREGRVLAGEVLQTLDGGTLVLGIGGQRVPAESKVELPAGERFLFQVEEHDGELQLRIVGRPLEEPVLLRALRASIGDELPMAKLLESLVLS